MTQFSRHIHINGIVQGVGFRPFIYNLALAHKLNGWVRNSANGVDIEVTGDKDEIEAFQLDIPRSAPPLAQIDSMDVKDIHLSIFDSFKIIPSKDKTTDFVPVSPDVAICRECQTELFDPQDRRYRYPFINCTNCGPRFTIIKDIPYDRLKTTMAGFEMCPDCREEYENPRDRRFHAQPVACPACGPQVWLEITPGVHHAERDDAIRQARELLAEGKILAVKGLGGFHLACDATNPEAVARLRDRKHRPDKPFALMAFDIKTIRKYVETSSAAEDLLHSPQAPIVLMPKKPESGIAESVALKQANLGFMLPTTPLHLLLLEKETGYPEVFVMTSGNRSEEPVLHENDIAQEKLSGIADAFLMHNRPIYRRIDDSVFTIIKDAPYPIRRARGYAPNPIRLKHPLPQVLAAGPQMKNTFCLTRDSYAFLSHYIGEMENWETYKDYQRAIQHYESLFRIQPQAIGYDLHPDYLTTKYALQRAEAENLPAYGVQHHHAHLAAGMMEHGIASEEVSAGLIFDGTGYGSDGTIWGGEVLLGNCNEFTRLYHLKPVPLPGGEAAIRTPARMALSTLWAYGLSWQENLAPVNALSAMERSALRVQLEKGINSPLTSSIGRLFDAVSALIGVRERVTYEAQAAIELEALADAQELGYYPWGMDGDQINVKPMLEGIIADLVEGKSQAIISARFHNTIAELCLELARKVRQRYNIHQIILSGGVWQNQLLLKKTINLLNNNGFQPLIHRQMPPNDGCVAFGQAMITAYRYIKDKE
jgi:hydrogenase maturation protein HypF